MDQNHTATTDRLQWVDTAKSLGLLLVIWGHLLYGGLFGGVNRAIYSFHMPLYFVLSGIVYRGSALKMRQTISKYFFRLIIPVISFLVLFSPIYIIGLINSGNPIDAKHIIADYLYIKGKVAYDVPLWFFICLFEVLVIAYFIRLHQMNKQIVMVIALISFLTGFIMYQYVSICIFPMVWVEQGYFGSGLLLCWLWVKRGIANDDNQSSGIPYHDRSMAMLWRISKWKSVNVR